MYPGVEEGGERVPGLHCLCMRLIVMSVHTLVMSQTCHVDVPVSILFEHVLSRAVLYFEMKLKKGQVGSIVCIYVTFCGYPLILVS